MFLYDCLKAVGSTYACNCICLWRLEFYTWDWKPFWVHLYGMFLKIEYGKIVYFQGIDLCQMYVKIPWDLQTETWFFRATALDPSQYDQGAWIRKSMTTKLQWEPPVHKDHLGQAKGELFFAGSYVLFLCSVDCHHHGSHHKTWMLSVW